MTVIKIQAFRGEVPRTSPKLLGDQYAQTCVNLKLSTGSLTPLKEPLPSFISLKSPMRSIYHYEHKEVPYWLTWDKKVDVVRSPIANDEHGRLYFTGDGEAQITTFQDAIGVGNYPSESFALGVVAPQFAPTVTVVGGAAPLETRSYVTTFLLEYQGVAYTEESAPSLPTTLSGNIDGSWNLTGLELPLSNSGAIASGVISAGVATLTVDTTSNMRAGANLIISTGLTGTIKAPIEKILSPTSLSVKVSVTGAIGAGTWELAAKYRITGLKRRIYRVGGVSTTFRLVAEQDALLTSYSDTVPTSALVTELTTLNASLPPENLHSLIGLPNGTMAGLSGNELCFSEINKPHSWPVDYRYSFPAVGVALSNTGNSVIVLTDSYHYFATATVPEAVSMAQIESYAPCVAKESVVDIGEGCLYASHDGLYIVTGGQIRKITDSLYKREEWKQLKPETFKAAFFDGYYYATHENLTQAPSVFIFDTAATDSVTNMDVQADCLHTSSVNGKLYLAKKNKIYEWDAVDLSNYVGFWRSKEFVLPQLTNFAFGQIYGQFNPPLSSEQLIANNQLLIDNDEYFGSIADDELLALPVAGSYIQPISTIKKQVQIILYIDGVPFFTKQILHDRPFRLPSGYKTDRVSIGLSTNTRVDSVVICEVAAELKGV